MKEPKPSTKIVLKALKQFPDTGNLTLAKKIYTENKLIFSSVDHVRSIIRTYRGSIGDRSRKVVKNVEHRKPLFFGNNFGIPEGLNEKWDVFTIPSKYDKILLLSDIHAPYHDTKALNAAIQYGLDQKANCIILNGDILDMYKASFHEKDPANRDLKYEIDFGRLFLKNLRELFPDAYIVYKEGNHEYRWERYLKIKAPELLNIAEFRLQYLLKLTDLKIEWVNKKRRIRAGKLYVMHGHEFTSGMAAPVNPARGFYMKAKENMIGGHHHQNSSHVEPSLSGKVITTFSVGCLCDLFPDYMPINKWSHGFGYITTSKDGMFKVRNIRIINGEIV